MPRIYKLLLTIVLNLSLFFSSKQPANAKALDWFAALWRGENFRIEQHFNFVAPLFPDGDRREGFEGVRDAPLTDPITVPEFDLITGAFTFLSSGSVLYLVRKRRKD